MKLLKAHIDRFAGLSNRDFVFGEGVTETLEENGYGKSTLAFFLAAAFYGFWDEKTKKKNGGLRDSALPGTPGNFGGYIEFTYNSADYRLERYFGSKPSEDTLKVWRLETMLLTDELGDCPGNTLFKLDGESFAGTILLRDNDCRAVVSDKVHAKIGNLFDDAMDIGNYETADRILKDAANRLTPFRETGLARRLERELTELYARNESGPEIENRIRDVEAKLSDLEIRHGETLRNKERVYAEMKQEDARKRDALSSYEQTKLRDFEKLFSECGLYYGETEEIRGISERYGKDLEISEGLKDRKEALDRQVATERLLSEKSRKAGKGGGSALLVVGVLAILAGAAGYFFQVLSALGYALWVYGALSVFGFLLLLSGIGFLASAGRKGRKDAEMPSEGMLRETTAELAKVTDNISRNGRFLTEFFGKFHMEFRLKNVETDLARLEQSFSEWKVLSEKEKHFQEAEGEKRPGEVLGNVVSLHAEYDLLSERVIAEEREKLSLLRDLENAEQASRELRENVEKAREIREKRETAIAKHDVLVKTREYLAEAKESLSAKYRSPVETRFRTYLNAMLGAENESFSLSADGEILKEENGRILAVNLLSHGYRDLCYFALRLALTDVMYEAEKPPLILDDPFVHLDADKIEKAKRLLREVGKTYQVLYFTCHESRSYQGVE